MQQVKFVLKISVLSLIEMLLSLCLTLSVLRYLSDFEPLSAVVSGGKSIHILYSGRSTDTIIVLIQL